MSFFFENERIQFIWIAKNEFNSFFFYQSLDQNRHVCTNIHSERINNNSITISNYHFKIKAVRKIKIKWKKMKKWKSAELKLHRIMTHLPETSRSFLRTKALIPAAISVSEWYSQDLS